jgi:hypothetical protein
LKNIIIQNLSDEGARKNINYQRKRSSMQMPDPPSLEEQDGEVQNDDEVSSDDDLTLEGISEYCR